MLSFQHVVGVVKYHWHIVLFFCTESLDSSLYIAHLWTSHILSAWQPYADASSYCTVPHSRLIAS